MNEPSVFNGPEITMRKDLMHVRGTVEHREVHNAFGMYYHAATAEGLRKRRNERPLVLSRAFFAGTQRIGPVWTGDNAADWAHLRKSVPMTLTLGVVGLTWSGADVGGFFGDPEAELMTRWYQIGVFYPFFRGHAHLDTKRREPWMFEEPHAGYIRTAIRRRYALMPYLYTLFEAAHREGAPVLRPAWYEFPEDDALRKTDDVAMLGPALLVAPVLAPGATVRTTYLPKGVWYDYETGERFVGPVTVSKPVTAADAPLYARGGFIVPRRDRARRSTRAAAGDPVTLLVAPDERGNAVGEVYLDDGVGYAYADGAFLRRGLTFTQNALACGFPSAATAKASGAEGYGGSVSPTPGKGEAPDDRGISASRDFPEYATRVERVVLMGAHPDDYRSATVRGENSETSVEVVETATAEGAGAAGGGGAVAARNPNVALADDWSVEFIRG
jgi:alpha 1,3-glucosidase